MSQSRVQEGAPYEMYVKKRNREKVEVEEGENKNLKKERTKDIKKGSQDDRDKSIKKIKILESFRISLQRILY